MGPSGVLGSAGGLPRLEGTVWTKSVLPSGIHCTGSPTTALSLKPSSFSALAVTTSPTHNSIPSVVVLVKANLVPSGDHSGTLRYGLAGRPVILRVLPVAISTRLSATKRGGWCLPFVAGLMRRPARRSMGCARSEMGGLASRSALSSHLPLGLTCTVGVGGALRISEIGCGAF